MGVMNSATMKSDSKEVIFLWEGIVIVGVEAHDWSSMLAFMLVIWVSEFVVGCVSPFVFPDSRSSRFNLSRYIFSSTEIKNHLR